MGFASLKASLQGCNKKTLVVAWGLDGGVLQASRKALDASFLDKVIVTAPSDELKNITEQANLNLDGFELHDVSSPEEGAAKAVRFIQEGQGDFLMKGHLNTSVILRAILDRDKGIRSKKLLSHIAIIELPSSRLALLTDAAMNIEPDLTQKMQILDNAINFAWSIGLKDPKVAVLASVESVNPQMQDTVDAAALTLMGKRGQFSKSAVVDGPLAFDNAYSKEAAIQKGITSEVAGQADIFMVPNLTSGNLLYKSFGYVGGFPMAGVVVGAKCPIVLTSRADSVESKLNAIVVSCFALEGNRGKA